MDIIATVTNSSAEVGSENVLVLAENSDRVYLRITNNSPDKIYLALGEDAVYGSGISLIPQGDSFVLPQGESMWKGSVYAISNGKTKTICICEGTE